MECLMGMKKYEEAFTMSTPLMKSSHGLANILYWRAQCLYQMVRGGNYRRVEEEEEEW